MKTGRVVYTGRAFHQDASEAMKGDIVRALIELITNSDDAYGNQDGRIRIEIERSRASWAVIARDRACGMRTDKMETVLGNLGGRTSGFEIGKDVRGNLGRGAKDLAAFGEVTFESICDDRFSRFVMEQSGDFRVDDERRVQSSDRARLGVPHTGTVVTIRVEKKIRCPQHSKLVDKLCRHFQLRGILSDPQRSVILTDAGEEVPLRFTFPPRHEVFSEIVSIDGYPDATASIVIFRNAERYDEPASDPLRLGGLLIQGRKAIYENTYFGLQSHPMAGWFSGSVTCPYIDRLAQEYDDQLTNSRRYSESNPMPIITRRRDGLQHNHPFYDALAKAVEKPLRELTAIEEESRRRSDRQESPRLRRVLDTLGRDLGKLVDEDLRDAEEEGLPSDGPGGEDTVSLRLIPEQVVLYLGEEKTVSLVVPPHFSGATADISVDPADIVAIEESVVHLAPHRRRPQWLSGQIRVRPLVEGEAILSARCGGQEAVAMVEVRTARQDGDAQAIPTALAFERDRYRVAWNRRKKLIIMAPVELGSEQHTLDRVVVSGSGVVVRSGTVTLHLEPERRFYVGTVEVEGRDLGGQVKVHAEMGGQRALCTVEVTRFGDGPGLKILVIDDIAGPVRAATEIEDGQHVIKIYGRHPVLLRYRGRSTDHLMSDNALTNTVIAELVADQAAQLILRRKYTVSSGVAPDADEFYSQHYHYLNRYLLRCHKALVDVDEIDAFEQGAVDG